MINNLLELCSDQLSPCRLHQTCLTNCIIILIILNWDKFCEIIAQKINFKTRRKCPNDVESTVQNLSIFQFISCLEFFYEITFKSSKLTPNTYSNPLALWIHIRIPSDKKIFNHLPSLLKLTLKRLITLVLRFLHLCQKTVPFEDQIKGP